MSATMPILPGTTVPTAATVDTGPVAGSTIGKFSWTSDRRRAWISNNTGQTVFAKINAAGATVSAADHQYMVTNGEMQELTWDGTVAVLSVDIFVVASGTVANLEVNGIAV